MSKCGFLPPNNRLSASTLVIFGRKGCGKHTLVRALQRFVLGNETTSEIKSDTMTVSALDYAYVDIRSDPNGDNSGKLLGRCNIWMMEDPSQASFLAAKLKATDFERLSVAICLDYTNPTTVLEDFHMWQIFITNFFSKIFQDLSLETQDKLRARVENILSNTVPSPFRPVTNLGFPIFTLVTKCDASTFSHFESLAPSLNPTLLAFLRVAVAPLGATLAFLTAPRDLSVLEGVAGAAATAEYRIKGGGIRWLYRVLVAMLYHDNNTSTRHPPGASLNVNKRQSVILKRSNEGFASAEGAEETYLENDEDLATSTNDLQLLMSTFKKNAHKNGITNEDFFPKSLDFDRSVFISGGTDTEEEAKEFLDVVTNGNSRKPLLSFIPPELYKVSANSSSAASIPVSTVSSMSDFLKGCHDALVAAASGVSVVAKPPPPAVSSRPPLTAVPSQPSAVSPPASSSSINQPTVSFASTTSNPPPAPVPAVSSPPSEAPPPVSSRAINPNLIAPPSALSGGVAPPTNVTTEEKKSFFKNLISRAAPSSPRAPPPSAESK
eukprot:GDKJ01047424.1.p1 GENE.GDKJ01047424.1~~GDKJ01047424.1.p1  ORF type:complete len:551 (+),score=147.20 GDKJ01047424.1:45-1697(+)